MRADHKQKNYTMAVALNENFQCNVEWAPYDFCYRATCKQCGQRIADLYIFDESIEDDSEPTGGNSGSGNVYGIDAWVVCATCKIRGRIKWFSHDDHVEHNVPAVSM